MGKDHTHSECSWITKPDHSPNEKQVDESSPDREEGEFKDHKRQKEDRRRITTQTTNMRDHGWNHGNVQWDCAVQRADRIRDVCRSQIRLVFFDHNIPIAVMDLHYTILLLSK